MCRSLSAVMACCGRAVSLVFLLFTLIVVYTSSVKAMPNPNNDVNTATSRPCREGMRRCSTTQRCIRGDYFCDGDNDCGDYSDERRDICPAITCVYDMVICPNTNVCVFADSFCDGVNDCGDAADELPAVCASRTCPSAFVRCNNGQCIHQEEFCDNESTCNDGSQPDRSQNCRN